MHNACLYLPLRRKLHRTAPTWLSKSLLRDHASINFAPEPRIDSCSLCAACNTFRIRTRRRNRGYVRIRALPHTETVNWFAIRGTLWASPDACSKTCSRSKSINAFLCFDEWTTRCGWFSYFYDRSDIWSLDIYADLCFSWTWILCLTLWWWNVYFRLNILNIFVYYITFIYIFSY